MGDVKSIRRRMEVPEPFKRILDYEVRVTQDGHFTTTLPDPWYEEFSSRGIYLPHNRLGKGAFFEDTTLVGLDRKIEASFKELCSEEVVSEVDVIRYQIAIACSYTLAKNGSGVFFPFVVSGTTTEWRGGNVATDANRPSPTGVSVYAHPFKKTVLRFKATGAERTEYTSLRKHSFMPPEDDTQWLGTLCSQCETGKIGVDEVPLTPATLSFFRQLYEGIFRLNERIGAFLSPEQIVLAANNGISSIDILLIPLCVRSEFLFGGLQSKIQKCYRLRPGLLIMKRK